MIGPTSAEVLYVKHSFADATSTSKIAQKRQIEHRSERRRTRQDLRDEW